MAGHDDDLGAGIDELRGADDEGRQRIIASFQDRAHAIGNLRHAMDDHRHVILIDLGRGQLNHFAHEFDSRHRSHAAQDPDQSARPHP